MKPQYIEINSIGTYYWSDKAMNTLHREDGPAIDCVNGTKHWYLNGKYHRVDGPAIEYCNGIKIWLINDKYHREDGPAIVDSKGYKAWYINGDRVTQEEHARLTRKVPTININGKEFTVKELNSLIKTAEGN